MDIIDQLYSECRDRADIRTRCMNSIFVMSNYDQALLDLPILVLLDKWKRQRTKSQNIKMEKLNVYVTLDRVKSHSLKVHRELEEQDLKNINKIVMKKKEKRFPLRYETLLQRGKEVTGKQL